MPVPALVAIGPLSVTPRLFRLTPAAFNPHIASTCPVTNHGTQRMAPTSRFYKMTTHDFPVYLARIAAGLSRCWLDTESLGRHLVTGLHSTLAAVGITASGLCHDLVAADRQPTE